MTAEDFERQYCERSGWTVEQFRKYKTVRPCDCDYEGCHGWQALTHDLAAEYDQEHAVAGAHGTSG